MTQRTILLDLDDTLIECGIYYNAALNTGGELIEQYTGVPRALGVQLIRDLDLLALKFSPSFAKERFPRSFAAAMQAAFALTAAPLDMRNQAVEEALAAGWSVFHADYALKPGVFEALESLRSKGFRLILVTKGDTEIQTLKIDKHGLSTYFDAIEIVADKAVATWQGVYDKHGIVPAKSVVVGDSLKDDIAPNAELGAFTIHILPQTHWSFNHSDVVPDMQLLSLLKAVPYVTTIGASL